VVRKAKQKAPGRLPIFALLPLWRRFPSPRCRAPSMVLRRKRPPDQACLAGHRAVELLPQHPCAQPGLGPQRILASLSRTLPTPFSLKLIQSFEEIAVAHGYEILVSSSNSDPAVLTTCVRRMLERKVEGVAVLTSARKSRCSTSWCIATSMVLPSSTPTTQK